MNDLGNHALCGSVARILEDFKIEGQLTHEKRVRLLQLISQIDERSRKALDSAGFEPGDPERLFFYLSEARGLVSRLAKSVHEDDLKEVIRQVYVIRRLAEHALWPTDAQRNEP